MIYPHGGILFSHKKEWSTNTCYSMTEFWKSYAKWKGLDTNAYTVWSYPYENQEQQISRDIKPIGGCIELAMGWGE